MVVHNQHDIPHRSVPPGARLRCSAGMNYVYFRDKLALEYVVHISTLYLEQDPLIVLGALATSAEQYGLGSYIDNSQQRISLKTATSCCEAFPQSLQRQFSSALTISRH